MIEDLSVWDRHAHQMYASRSSKETPRQKKTRPSGRPGGGGASQTGPHWAELHGQDAQIYKLLSFVYC